MISCPECSKQISETAKTCPNCGCNVKQAQKKKQQQQAAEAWDKLPPEQKTRATIVMVVIVGLIVALIFGLYQCSKDDVKTYSATCQTCYKTYSYEGHEYGGWEQRNVKCISMTNMCKKCYESYCWSVGITPKDY